MPVHSEGGRWAVAISLLALVLSAFSLYETNLKQARPVLHVGAVMYYARDPEGVEAFAVPVTITNRGARDAIVTALELRAAQSTPGAVATLFAGSYLAVGNSLSKDRQPFTPLSLPGRGSYTGIVVFQAADLKIPSTPTVTRGGETLRFCARARAETSQDYLAPLDALLAAAPSALTFEAELPWFAAKALDAGQAVTLQIKNAQRDEAARGKRGAAPICE
jgi:hypothetical protein